MFSGSRLEAIVATAIVSVLLVPQVAYSHSPPAEDDSIQLELAAMAKRGGTIRRVREQALAILQAENACSAWFREADPEPSVVLRSLHYEIVVEKASFVFRIADGQGGKRIKHPWGARTTENGGRNSNVTLNGNGAFFNAFSPVMDLDQSGTIARPGGFHLLTIASFKGNTAEAQIIILLHELGHIIGRLPEDDDSWDGRSSLNSKEVVRHCGEAIHMVAHESPRGGN